MLEEKSTTLSPAKSFFHTLSRSMMTTYNLYIPGPYENFAEQATEVPLGLLVTEIAQERTESGGQSVGQGREKLLSHSGL